LDILLIKFHIKSNDYLRDDVIKLKETQVKTDDTPENIKKKYWNLSI
jgi:hypothetical protein